MQDGGGDGGGDRTARPPFDGGAAAAARRLILKVVESWNRGVVLAHEDHAARDVLTGYARGFTLVESLLVIAETGDAASTSIIARALVSTALRTLWLVQDDDPFERELRRRSQNRRFYGESLKTFAHIGRVTSLRDTQVAMREQTQRAAAQNDAWFAEQAVKQGRAVAPYDLDEASVAKRVGLDAAYAVIYRPASHEMHADTGSLLARMTLHEEGGRVVRVEVPLRFVDHAECEIILEKALLVYSALIGGTEQEVGHGISARATFVELFGEERTAEFDWDPS